MTQAYIGLGSNMEPEASIPKALELLARQVRLEGLSTFRRTAPVGPAGQPEFVNGVARVSTDLPPRSLKFEVLRGIEAALGRRRGPDQYAPRTIDLDLLLYGDLVSDEPDLVLPDPDLRTRPFLAAALLELAPGLVKAVAGSPGEPMTDFSQRLKERFIQHESQTH
ncbi:MAG: 2-amino-4-hydroxy-6-hydroxymethyldihydropteridine diphosphokinase [Elusimicrobia bacterium]|nr:2-amino-4-hydroxy-6-hydroxymethyldihydropteridine diphosphokinase [Elusimicrobiota bacterium]